MLMALLAAVSRPAVAQELDFATAAAVAVAETPAADPQAATPAQPAKPPDGFKVGDFTFKPGGRIKLITPHYTNPDWATDPTHRNHINSYTFNTFMPERAVFDFYTDVKLRPVSTYVSLLGLWRALGIEFLVNLDQRARGLRFTRKFWEHYLSYIFRGKEIFFEFEVVK